MRLLIDTHVLLWAVAAPERLSIEISLVDSGQSGPARYRKQCT